eukprot:TRINITY_DN5963_c0_g1_i2.p2 TRINITY_DN5963_c0_g1~~TRINITY_DN5963_c0_g1_i2.p2  ORF type:complete len:105 (+),score=14.77 TRINITY_DN5963_c0_g1_i2:502-816(+)
MLLEFSVENFMSFKEQTTFSMLASTKKTKDDLDGAITDINKTNILKSVAIYGCLLYTSDAADDTPCVDLGGRRIIKKKKQIQSNRPPYKRKNNECNRTAQLYDD